MNDLSQAKRLIKECLETQNTYLDLGNCGITNLGELPELFECVHVETLILSNSWYDLNTKTRIGSKNRGKPNDIKYITKDIIRLQNLRSLILEGENSDSNILDVSFLKDLVGLVTLNLSRNQLTDISFLQNLVQ